ncbi:MAG: DNA polymerase III subunit gamma/tau [Porticoccaceae bacterium]
MSYQVLARKWRPRIFTEMVGQEHVLRALVNGLDNDRLHHAYLFTGTRGVGKTTIARILAKCLNCESGVSSTPCGECSACREIAEGRFVDLIEVDAASRTKVEDTRELLDNVQYLPTRGRYKVYLIDEVHMLTNHSFNALLKTLEEPPPHVKFLLATTDPQKLPVTVLSRCLQFNLKNLGPERIVGHLKHVLGEEKIPCEEAALWELGRAADGSMRDALSLTDQAIAHGGGALTVAEVSAMLGTMDRGAVVDLCSAVAGGDASDVLAGVERLADHAPDYSAALADMLAIWHQVAMAQALPDALDPVHEHHGAIMELAENISREDVQLFYQITLLGRKDLPHAADPRSGFEMVLLRLLAFRPLMPDQAETAPPPSSSAQRSEAAHPAKKPEPTISAALRGGAGSVPPATPVAPAVPTQAAVAPAVPAAAVKTATPEPPRIAPVAAPAPAAVPDEYEAYGNLAAAPWPDEEPAPVMAVENQPPVPKAVVEEEVADADVVIEPAAIVEKIPLDRLRPGDWPLVCQGLGRGGLLQNLASNMALKAVSGESLDLVLDVDSSALYGDTHRERLQELLGEYFQTAVVLRVAIGEAGDDTPRKISDRNKAARLAEAVESLRADPHVRELCRVFGAELIESSVKPIDPESPGQTAVASR